MAKWIMLISGSLGFIIGSMWGNSIGSSRGTRKNIMRSQVGSFFLGIILGFFIPLYPLLSAIGHSFCRSGSMPFCGQVSLDLYSDFL